MILKAAIRMYTRRSFLLKLLNLCGLSSTLLTSCQAKSDAPAPARRVRLGFLRDFSAPQRILFLERVLVQHDKQGLSALSLTCTHQSCMVQTPESLEGEYHCPCHGSRFDQSGKVLIGPAERDLPWLTLDLDSQQQVWATFGKPVTKEWRLTIPELT
jgi:nitrite reductase/ring-hydroxylating ferredoxin subunit